MSDPTPRETLIDALGDFRLHDVGGPTVVDALDAYLLAKAKEMSVRDGDIAAARMMARVAGVRDTARHEEAEEEDWVAGDCECADEVNCPVHSPLAFLRAWWRRGRGAARFDSYERSTIDVALSRLGTPAPREGEETKP